MKGTQIVTYCLAGKTCVSVCQPMLHSKRREVALCLCTRGYFQLKMASASVVDFCISEKEILAIGGGGGLPLYPPPIKKGNLKISIF